MESYSELEYQRRHLVEQKTPKDRTIVMVGIDRLLDQMLDTVEYDTIETALPNSTEGEAHLAKGTE